MLANQQLRVINQLHLRQQALGLIQQPVPKSSIVHFVERGSSHYQTQVLLETAPEISGGVHDDKPPGRESE